MCGIAAFLGKRNPNEGLLDKSFDYLALYYIMMRQESRGGDSCGIAFKCQEAIDNGGTVKIMWGSRDDKDAELKQDTSKISDFIFYRSPEIRDSIPTYPYMFISHARKGTGATANRDNAHPFKYGNVVGVHNGVIDDWRAFAGKLGVDVTGVDCDSESMIRAIGSGKVEQFFSRYKGNAAVVWYDTEEDCNYVWAGKSSGYDTVKRLTEDRIERPLHYLDTEAGLYISSEAEPLWYIYQMKGADYCNSNIPTQFETNCIIKIKDGVIVDKKEITRIKEEPVVTKTPPVVTKTTALTTVEKKDLFNDNTESVLDVIPRKGMFKPSFDNCEVKNLRAKDPGTLAGFHGLYTRYGCLACSFTPAQILDYPMIPESKVIFFGLLLEKFNLPKVIEIIEKGGTDMEMSRYTLTPVPSGYCEVVREHTCKKNEVNFSVLIANPSMMGRINNYWFFKGSALEYDQITRSFTYDFINTSYTFSTEGRLLSDNYKIELSTR